jgi:acyl-CoA synthetase (AMP-forming)/AMP-acid ligase II
VAQGRARNVTRNALNVLVDTDVSSNDVAMTAGSRTYKIPRSVRFVDALLHTATGKIARRQLRESHDST